MQHNWLLARDQDLNSHAAGARRAAASGATRGEAQFDAAAGVPRFGLMVVTASAAWTGARANRTAITIGLVLVPSFQ